MLKNNKTLFIFLTVLILLFSFCTFSFATVSYDYNGSQIEFADLPFDITEPNTYYFIIDGYYGYSLCVYKGSDFDKFIHKDGRLYAYNTSGQWNSTGHFYLSDYNTSSKSWGRLNNWNDVSGGFYGIIVSNVNIYNSDGSVFFRGAPLGLLGVIVEKTEPQEVMKEILGILPLILVVVVSLIGLRKALQMLFKLLRQS